MHKISSQRFGHDLNMLILFISPAMKLICHVDNCQGRFVTRAKNAKNDLNLPLGSLGVIICGEYQDKNSNI